ncbi:MAG: nitrogenase component 1 [Candidatus Methanomethylophilaceae archaeon]
MHSEPCGTTGAVMAIEGIPDATVILHGQNGCRKGLVQSQILLPRSMRDRLFEVPFYMGERTVPISGIMAPDYTGRTYEKLSSALDYISREDYGMAMLMTSSGVSIVGDDLERAVRDAGMEGKTVIVDPDDLECPVTNGFDIMIRRTLEHLSPVGKGPIEGTVNLLGLSIMHKDWMTVRQEMSKVLMKAGLKVLSAPGAGSTTDEIRRSVDAEYNIIVDPDHCRETERFYSERYGIPSISIGCCPVGFDATGELIGRIGDATGGDISHGLSMLENARKRAYDCITSTDSDVRGVSFKVESNPAMSVPLTEWLRRSLGMVPTEHDPDILFTSGNRAIIEQAAMRCGKGVDIGFPSTRRIGFAKAPVMWTDGALYLLDRIFN